ncbi:hypothetical protein LJB42_002457 [Komagataella kurtzmanii]|nr:hypothetical protein LJB42_002457 [Komagataella kurtzmanii]
MDQEDKALLVYVPKPGDEEFVKARVLTENPIGDDEIEIEVKTLDGEQFTTTVKHLDRVNPVKFDKCDDMASLTHLNEPSVLDNLKRRYLDGLIYTYSGLFLVAVNPYKKVNIYDRNTIDYYQSMESSLYQQPQLDGDSAINPKPHIFAVAQNAIQRLVKEQRNQSILVTGESGAGKTENTKKIIQYITTITASHELNQDFDFEEKILQATPILESFGNAQTVKNNNSSRFGKFIKMDIDYYKKTLAGASIQWYLLEKSRVVKQDAEERNYHIFYQLLRGLSQSELSKYRLTNSITDFNYLKYSHADIPNVDDSQDFQNLMKALQVCDFSETDIKNIFTTLAVILLLGNITYHNPDSDKQAIPTEDAPFTEIQELLQLENPHLLKNAIIKPKVKAGRESVTQEKNSQQAKVSVDALAKVLYENLFGFIVDKINNNFGYSGLSSNTSFIGILDIAGFEIFQKNSFEQLCINYTNEKLQQFFNHHMFVLEQAEYVKENISWKFVDFGNDLKPTIELLENKPNSRVGIFSILDEECLIPKGSDEEFLNKLHKNFEIKEDGVNSPYGNARYKPTKVRNGFIVKHYAGDVTYDVDGWLGKNKDPLNENIIEVLSSSSNPFFVDLFSSKLKAVSLQSSPSKKNKGTSKTVATKHKEQLSSLINQLSQTHPHFVRCILPNNQRSSNMFDQRLILDQLRCNGVLEGIRIARAGYPNRIPFDKFYSNYGFLSRNKIRHNDNNFKSNCEIVLNELELSPNDFKVGLTKLFFKNGVLAVLEERKAAKLSSTITGLQANIRGFIQRSEFVDKLRKHQASRLISKNFKEYYHLSRNDEWYKLALRLTPLIEGERKLAEKKKFKTRIDSLIKQVATLEEEKVSFSVLKSELEESINVLTNSLESERSLSNTKDKELANEKARSIDLEKSLSDANQQIEKQENDGKIVNNELLTLKKELEKLTEMEKQKCSLDNKVKSLSQELIAAKSLQQEVESLKGAIANREQGEADLKNTKILLESKLNESNLSFEKASAELSKLKEENNTVNAKLNQLVSAQAEREKKLERRERELQEKAQDLESRLSQVHLVEQEKKKAIDDYTAIKEENKLLKQKANSILVLNTKLEREAREANSLLEAKIADDVKFERGKKAFDDQISQLKEKVEELTKELSIEKENSSRDKISLKALDLENAKLLKAKKSYDVRTAELNLQLQQSKVASPASPKSFFSASDTEVNKLNLQLSEERAKYSVLKSEKHALEDELNFVKTRLASEAYDNRQLKAKLSTISEQSGIPIERNNLLSSPIKASRSSLSDKIAVDASELKIQLETEKAANKRLETMNVELQTELLRYKTLSSRLNNQDFRPVDFGNVLKDSTNDLNKMNQDEPANSLRLNSMLNEANTKLKRLQTGDHVSQQQEIVQYKSKIDRLVRQNQDLKDSLELYKSRSENYYSKLEAAEVAVKASKRSEEFLRGELQVAQERIGVAQENYRKSDLMVAQQNSTIRELQKELSDSLFNLKKLKSKYEDLEEKFEQETDFRLSTTSSLSANKDREIESLNKELFEKMEKEVELNKRAKSLTMQLETTQKENRALTNTTNSLIKEKHSLDRMITEMKKANDELNAKQIDLEHKVATSVQQVITYKATVEDLNRERNNLLESKRLLEVKVADITKDLEARMRIYEDANSNPAHVSKLTNELNDYRQQVRTFKDKTEEDKLRFKEYSDKVSQLTEHVNMTVEENKALSNYNEQLSNKIKSLEASSNEMETNITNHWSERVKSLEEKLAEKKTKEFDENQNIFNLQSLVKDLNRKIENYEKLNERSQNEVDNLGQTMKRLNDKIESLQEEGSQVILLQKQLERERDEFKEKSLKLEKELLDVYSN